MRNYIPLLFIFIHCYSLFSQDVTVNEIVYTNKNLLYDEDGSTPDWIEIYNGGNESVNLEGYQLSDEISDDSYWQFPDVNIKPDSLLLIFLSGKTDYPENEIHADFKLRVMEDTLYFFDAQGTLIEEIIPQCVPPDYSLSRVPDGSDSLYVTAATPLESNNNAAISVLHYKPDTLIVNYPGGFYNNSSLELRFTKHDASNTIRYTLDADDPNTDAEVYTDPIVLKDITGNENRFANEAETEYEPGDLILKANVVRAQVYSEGCPAGNEISNTYFIGNNIKERYNVPVVSIITDKDNLFSDEEGIYVYGAHENYERHGKQWERQVQLEIFDSSGTTIVEQDAGIRIHGAGSRHGDQKSFRLYARDEYGEEYFNYPFFEHKPEITRYKTLILRRSQDWTNPTIFKDELCQYLVKDMDIYYTDFKTCVAFINGEYWGIYGLRERQDEDYIAANLGIETTSADIISYKFDNFEIEEGDAEEYNSLVSTLENLDPDDSEYFDEVSKLIDIDELIDYHIAQIYISNTDFPKNNVKLWRLKNDTARWHYFFFDLDAVMIDNNFNIISEYTPKDESDLQYPEYSTVIVRSLLQNKTFRDKFYRKFNYHLQSTFSADTILKTINYFETIYTPLANEHIYRWGNPPDYKQWQNNVTKLKTFAMTRAAYMTEQLYSCFGNPFTVYPNPSDGNFTINGLNSDEKIKTELYDIRGKKHFSGTVSSDTNGYIYIESSLSAGEYILYIHQNGIIYAQTVIVKH